MLDPPMLPCLSQLVGAFGFFPLRELDRENVDIMKPQTSGAPVCKSALNKNKSKESIPSQTHLNQKVHIQSNLGP